MRHDRIPMLNLGKHAHKTRPTKHYRNGKNYWFYVFECPICHARAMRLCNLFASSYRQDQPYCDGTRRPKNSLEASQWRIHGWQGAMGPGVG